MALEGSLGSSRSPATVPNVPYQERRLRVAQGGGEGLVPGPSGRPELGRAAGGGVGVQALDSLQPATQNRPVREAPPWQWTSTERWSSLAAAIASRTSARTMTTARLWSSSVR